MRRFVAVTTEISLLLGGLSAVAVAATYPLIRHLTTHLPNDLGDPVLVAWILGWDADAFRHGLGQCVLKDRRYVAHVCFSALLDRYGPPGPTALREA